MYFICTESFYCGNCLGKKYFQGWKMYFGCFNRIFRSFLTLLDFLLGLIDQFTERKRECCTFRPGNCYYLILFDTLFFNILSWVLLLNDCLKRRSPHIIAKLDEHITFVSFWKVFLMPLSWLFLYGIFVYVHITCFWDINQRFIVTVIEWGFFATMRGSQYSNFT